MYLHMYISSANEKFIKLFVNEIEDHTNGKVIICYKLVRKKL